MDFFNDHAVMFALLCSAVAIGYGIYLTAWLLRQPPGNERMREISRAVQEGASAYLRRQYTTVAIVAVVPFLLLGFYNKLGWGTAFGFVVGDAIDGGRLRPRAVRVVRRARVVSASIWPSRTGISAPSASIPVCAWSSAFASSFA